MTLRDLLRTLHLTVNYPPELGNLIVKNEKDFCRYALLKYFKTPKFQDDLQDCFSDLLLISKNFTTFLMLKRKEEEFSIYLSIDSDEFN